MGQIVGMGGMGGVKATVEGAFSPSLPASIDALFKLPALGSHS